MTENKRSELETLNSKSELDGDKIDLRKFEFNNVRLSSSCSRNRLLPFPSVPFNSVFAHSTILSMTPTLLISWEAMLVFLLTFRSTTLRVMISTRLLS